jgi:hypothetical protein
MITIVRKKNKNISWIRNALFYKEFPVDEFEFAIPSLSWMVYLCDNFDLIEATDADGKPLDLTGVKGCCGSYAKLNLNLSIKTKSNIKNPVDKFSEK